MSWIDRADSNMIIRTGDGREWEVLWMKAVKTKDFNVAEFNFPGVPGTFVSRGTPRGRQYNIEIFFQGDLHLDFSADFDNSSDDPRPWQITHPYYGSIFVQPISLSYDNVGHNVTKITGTVIETITEDRPKVRVNPADQVLNLADVVFEQSSILFSEKLPPVTLKDIATLRRNTESIFNVARKSIFDTVTFEAYFNLYNQALTAIENATVFPLEAITTVQAMINAPYQFADNVKNRLSILTGQFDLLVTTIGNITGLSEKRIYENNLTNIVSAMCLSSVTNFNYETRQEVILVIENILEKYNELIQSLESLQTESGEEDSFHPDVDTMLSLSGLVNFTLSNLFNVAVDARQQRTIILENDSNAILLTHRFYGMNETDGQLTRFINDNQIGLSEILGIKKGRKIIYYL
jgi:hypothetical protein